jgi:hypothetical protein
MREMRGQAQSKLLAFRYASAERERSDVVGARSTGFETFHFGLQTAKQSVDRK